jgi:RNA polymerase sigma-70 factor (ECF subfamily)
MSATQVDSKATLFGVAEYQTAVTRQELVSQAYEDNRDAIYRYLVALGTKPSVAQDLTQELFLKLYSTIGKGKQIQNVRAWMFTVASNLALNHLRAETYRPSLSGEDVGRWLESQAQPGADPEKALLERERAVALQEAISTLSHQQRVCLHLRAEGFRYREIAKILGVTVPTVAEFLRRAISKLQRADL